MWPWEHLLFGYLLHWPVGRLRGGAGLRDRPVLALVVATQFPDLVDKPLAWGLNILPSGLSLGHSALFALPVAVLAVALARMGGDQPTGVAFGIGYGSHLLGDLLYNSLLGGRLAWTFLLWPLIERPSASADVQFGVILVRLLGNFTEFLGTPAGLVYLTVEASLVLVTLLRWRLDGYPGAGYVRRLLRRSRG